ncbi:alkaline phosphatase-like protein [Basidiobolus meristosporus CBS 931.73]|uniref:Alkaline phosphatase-like protein n=1 Tax=Basidiobolus meristosporus CBS 931.73 TaxID=1314790 RepID=A0A1Y1YTV9_9FUNG|nr:alkaline phosphatase-like protein [Basidiobolus meristosporus CBS 931.73]|eukprot:ORY01472.1 alkaline phosphatase-like protein [Basidiobolus meristosporus CBS 931.73]
MQRSLSIVALAFLATQITVGQALFYPDANNDGLVNNDDVTFIRSFLGSNQAATNWQVAKSADVNRDGQVSSADVDLVTARINQFPKSEFKRVVFLGIDGGGSFLQWANTPVLKQFLNSGASTLNAAALLPTISGQNWGSMITGVTPNKHKLTNDIAASTPYSETSAYPTIFKLLLNERPAAKLAVYSVWKPIIDGMVERSLNVTKISQGDEDLTNGVVKYIKEKGADTRYLFIHYDAMDHVGHASGYNSTAYIQEYPKVDARVGRVLAAIEEAGLKDDTLVLMTADHGGTPGGSHGGSTAAEVNIFWGASGKGVKVAKLANGVRNMDIAATVANALRLPQPANWDSRFVPIY